MKKSLCLLGMLSVGGGGTWWFWPAPPPAAASGANALVRRGGFAIAIAEEGAFTAKESFPIKVKLEAFKGELTIAQVVEAGTSVKKGDVILAFDPAEIQRMISQAEVDLEAAKNDVVQATKDLELFELKAAYDLQRAQYDHDMAVLNLRKWQEIEAPKGIKEAEAKIRESLNARDEAKTNHAFLKDMRKEDLVSEAEVKRADLAAQKTETDLELSTLSLQLLRGYQQPLETRKLQDTVQKEKSFLEAFKSSIEAQRAQRRSAVLKADKTAREKTDYLDKLRRDLANLTVKAPVDGIVLYGDADQPYYYGERLKIAVGEKVNAHYTLMTIPDLSALKVKLGVGESDVNKVRPGLPVTLRPEALPDLVMKGAIKTVSSVVRRANYWEGDAGRGKFDVVVEVDGVDPRLKPGMKCKVDVAVDEIKDALVLPLDAIFEKEGKPFCYVLGRATPEERALKVGRSSPDFVEVLDGVRESEKVALYDPTKK